MQYFFFRGRYETVGRLASVRRVSLYGAARVTPPLRLRVDGRESDRGAVRERKRIDLRAYETVFLPRFSVRAFRAAVLQGRSWVLVRETTGDRLGNDSDPRTVLHPERLFRGNAGHREYSNLLSSGGGGVPL